MTTKLFSITFLDNTQLWATIQNGEICFGTLGKGMSSDVKPTFEKVPKNKICYFAEAYAEQSQYIKKFEDHGK
jgi:hypothetical protein